MEVNGAYEKKGIMVKIKSRFALLLVSALSFYGGLLAKQETNDIKLLVLVIASDQFPVYRELQKIWRESMHYDRLHVESYFIKGDPNLEINYIIKDDIIWSQTDEGWTPASAGVLNKTLLSLEALQPRFHEFDFILRTNLSSFYIFPRLLDFLKTLPKTGCYSGAPLGDNIASGAGFIMSPDVAELLIRGKNRLYNVAAMPDDCVIGHFLTEKGVKVTPHARLDVLTLQDWELIKNNVPGDIFQFRVKHLSDDKRMTEEVFIKNELTKIFYK